jgi:hypothetical protein
MTKNKVQNSGANTDRTGVLLASPIKEFRSTDTAAGWTAGWNVNCGCGRHCVTPELPLASQEKEVTVTDAATGAQKGSKPARFDLLPWGALWKIATHYGIGARKYEDRNWEKGYDWSLSFAALQRHLAAWWEGEDTDAETGSSHLCSAAFHVLALLTFTVTHPEKDNRPNSKGKVKGLTDE